MSDHNSAPGDEPLPIHPLEAAPNATVTIPGSKSLTNRAIIAALFGDGVSELRGALRSDDTEAMFGVARSLGAAVVDTGSDDTVTIEGTAGKLTPGPLDLSVNMSGTTARFCVPAAARGHGAYTIDGHDAMRARPMAETARALRTLGTEVIGDTLPMVVNATGGHGGSLTVAADASSQFVSGLLLSAPGLGEELDLRIDSPVVSMPYLDMTVAVMAAFGSAIDASDDGRHYHVPADDRYEATKYRIEPDASAASYFFAAAALTGGTVRVDGLGANALQGDVGFVAVLEQMGAACIWGDDYIEVTGPDRLRGIEVDMHDISDTAQTLAAIAPFADGPTRVTGIGFIRAKETDRISAVVTELQRLGIDAVEEADGFTIQPGEPTAGTVETYDDHRMAMSFSLIGLVRPGITIANPSCVAKTFPGFFSTLDQLR